MMKSGEKEVEILGKSRLFPLYPKNFSQLKVRNTLILPKEKPGIKSILKVNNNININDIHIILSPKATSSESQSLTGKKAVVIGEVIQKIEYRVENIKKLIASVQFRKFFSSCIILEDTVSQSSNIEVTPYIEDIYVKQIGERKVINDIMLLLVAESLSKPF